MKFLINDKEVDEVKFNEQLHTITGTSGTVALLHDKPFKFKIKDTTFQVKEDNEIIIK